jgi:uncharacterized protein YjgD (DUF1641 family)
MSNPIPFQPAPVDPTTELQRRLAAAPTEHAEALLALWDLLQAAHDQGLLDLAHGMVGGKDIILGKLSEYAALPEGIAGIRNLLSIAKILTTLDPETLDCLARSLSTAALKHKREATPPNLFQLAKRATSEDSRRGLSFLTHLLSSLGQSLKR